MKQDQHKQARNLYFETDLTQEQIAELVGISQKTISLWSNEGNWRRLRQIARETPMIVIDNMYSELSKINDNIQAREPGKRFATLEEAEIRRKTLVAISYVRQYEIPQSHAEVLYNFISFMRRQNLADTKIVVKYADNYLKGEIKLGQEKPFRPYNLHFSDPEPIPAADVPGEGYNLEGLSAKDKAKVLRWQKLVKEFTGLSGNAAAADDDDDTDTEANEAA